MINSNLHTHSLYCDGKSPLNTYVEKAIALGFDSLGFSSHAPLPFKKLWAMKTYNLEGYFDAIIELKENYQGRIELYSGLEADYIEGKVTPLTLKECYPKIDYLIGSVHFIHVSSLNKLVEIDGSHSKFLESSKSEGITPLIKQYYVAVRNMIKTQPIDILGHLDKIKIQNGKTHLFNETDNWYKDEIEQTLEVIEESSVVLEINTRGIYKQLTTEPYPSWWVIEKAISKGIKLTISSDTHHPKELQLGFNEVIGKLKQMNCKNLYFLKNGKWVEESLSI